MLVLACCPFTPPLVRAVLPDLQEHLVITDFETKELRDISGVVRAQSKKSPEEMVTTADILESHGFEKESKVLSGRLSSMLHTVLLKLYFAVDSPYSSLSGCTHDCPLLPPQTMHVLLSSLERN